MANDDCERSTSPRTLATLIAEWINEPFQLTADGRSPAAKRLAAVLDVAGPVIHRGYVVTISAYPTPGTIRLDREFTLRCCRYPDARFLPADATVAAFFRLPRADQIRVRDTRKPKGGP